MNLKMMLTATAIASVLGVTAPDSVRAHTDGAETQDTTAEMQSELRDAWLDGKLETALLFNEHLNSFNINTDVEHSVAYLNGAVESEIDRDLAEEIAKSINGITAVENHLVIEEFEKDVDKSNESSVFKQSVVDATLTAKVKSKLLVNDNTGGLAIDVDTNQGVVTLNGAVASEQEKDLAEQIARNTSGVLDVENALTIEA